MKSFDELKENIFQNIELQINLGIKTSLCLMMIEEKSFFGYAILRQFLNSIDSEDYKNFQREINTLNTNKQGYFNRIFLFGQNFLVLELLPYGDLNDYFKFKQPSIESFEFYKIISFIIKSLKILKDNKIIHRDIKPENIFLGLNFQPSLGDFGFAKFSNKIISKYPGTPGYVAPEIIKHEDYSYPVDIYSFGCTLYFLIFLERPYFNIQSEKLLSSSVSKNNIKDYYNLNNIKRFDINNFYHNIILQCMKIDPIERITIEKLILEMEKYGKEKFNINFNDLNYEECIEFNGSIEQICEIQSPLSYYCCYLHYSYINNEETANKFFQKSIEARFKKTLKIKENENITND